MGVHQKCGFDLAAADVFAAADDEIFDAVNDVQKAVGVDGGHVASAKPVAVKDLGVDFGAVPVTAE